MNFKPMLLALVAAIAASSMSAFDFNFQNRGEEISSYGTGSKDTYDVAVLVKAPALEGMKVTGLTVPLEAPGATNVSVWLTSELTLKKVSGVKTNTPDILSQEATVNEGVLDVTFSEPYTLTSEGVYVGYSFQLASCETEADKSPVASYPHVNPEGLFLHTKRAYINWENVSEKLGCVSAMNVKIDGTLQPLALGLEAPSLSYGVVNENVEVALTVKNHGTEPVNSFSYAYNVAGLSGSGEYQFEHPLEPNFNAPEEVKISLPAITERDFYEGTLSIQKVNSETNSEIIEQPLPVRILTFKPQKRVVMEEHTGLWCGWCPRGMACIEHLSADYPETFIGVAYHHGDAMEPACDIPSYGSGLPDSYLDRGSSIDPAYDTIYPNFIALSGKLPVANIEVEAVKDGEEIVATSTTTFLNSEANADYRIAYLLVGNSMSNPKWVQSNYYADQNAAEKAKWLERDSYLEPFVNGSHLMAGLKFNDVVVYTKNAKGLGGSVPTTIEADSPMNHSHRINLSEVVTSSGESLIQDEATYSVVALLINSSNGSVVNAARGIIGGSSSLTVPGMEAETGKAPVYYDLMGRHVTNPSHGLFICIKDGKVSKIVL